MTYNEKKRFLEGYSYSIRRIKGLQRELEQWTTIATGITQKLKPVIIKNGTTNSKIEDCAIRIAELENKLMKEINKAEADRINIETTIMTIRDTRRRELVQLRYIHNIPVSKLAQEYGKSEDNIYKTIRKTIKNMEI